MFNIALCDYGLPVYMISYNIIMTLHISVNNRSNYDIVAFMICWPGLLIRPQTSCMHTCSGWGLGTIFTWEWPGDEAKLGPRSCRRVDHCSADPSGPVENIVLYLE